MACSAVHGFVAGGAAAYLRGKVKEEGVKNTSDQWMLGALQVNHVLLLTAETIRSAGGALGAFGPFVQATYVLTPLALCLSSKQLTTERAEQLNKAYTVGVVGASVAAIALGNPVFGVASLSMLAIDSALKKGTLFDQVKKVAGFCALIGYGTQAFACEGLMAGLATVSTIAVGAKLSLWNFLQPHQEEVVLAPLAKTVSKGDAPAPSLSTSSEEDREFSSRSVHHIHHYYPRPVVVVHERPPRTVSEDRLPDVYQAPVAVPNVSTPNGNVFTRPSVFG